MTEAASHRLPGELPGAGEGAVVGSHDASSLRVAVVCSRFNEEVTSRLLEGATEAFERLGVSEDRRLVAYVPGAFELPLAADVLARGGRYDAVVCLGAVIRGETSHYDFVAGECARGIAEVARRTGVPVAFGVLTTESLEQALERSGGSLGNKGAEAVTTAVEMASVLAALGAGPR